MPRADPGGTAKVPGVDRTRSIAEQIVWERRIERTYPVTLNKNHSHYARQHSLPTGEPEAARTFHDDAWWIGHARIWQCHRHVLTQESTTAGSASMRMAISTLIRICRRAPRALMKEIESGERESGTHCIPPMMKSCIDGHLRAYGTGHPARMVQRIAILQDHRAYSSKDRKTAFPFGQY